MFDGGSFEISGFDEEDEKDEDENDEKTSPDPHMAARDLIVISHMI